MKEEKHNAFGEISISKLLISQSLIFSRLNYNPTHLSRAGSPDTIDKFDGCVKVSNFLVTVHVSTKDEHIRIHSAG